MSKRDASLLEAPARRVAYYARCQAIYGTPQEARDHALIRRLGYEPILFDAAIQEKCNLLKIQGKNVMEEVFRPLVSSSSILFFRALPDCRIPAGVAEEIQYAGQLGVPVIEIPSGLYIRVMGIEETREYLKEAGQR